MANEDQKIPLSNSLIQALGDYLISRPYREVAGLISALQTEVQSSVRPNAHPVDLPGQTDEARDLQ